MMKFALTLLSLLLVAEPAVGFITSHVRRSSHQRHSVSMSLKVGDSFPADALKSWGVSKKAAVLYFYGADQAPSCTKQASAFDSSLGEFKSLGVEVVGVRNEKGVKGDFADSYAQRFVVDEGDAVRDEIGIPKDLFVLGGRETYVVDKAGTVAMVFNDQFKPEAHVTKALEVAASLSPPKGKGKKFEFKLPF
uniref:thioredoxin-dependent peroxiredoxin n=1 Tax=Octactis speculum TaxID=3111310 RepID=A0A7S2H2W8_9STRA